MGLIPCHPITYYTVGSQHIYLNEKSKVKQNLHHLNSNFLHPAIQSPQSNQVNLSITQV